MAPCKYEAELDQIKKVAVVKLVGSLVFEDVINVSEEVKILFAEGWDNIIIDMSKITHVNSKGIGVLISIQLAGSIGDRKFIILNPSEEVMKILTVTKLNTVFNIFDGSLEDAKCEF